MSVTGVWTFLQEHYKHFLCMRSLEHFALYSTPNYTRSYPMLAISYLEKLLINYKLFRIIVSSGCIVDVTRIQNIFWINLMSCDKLMIILQMYKLKEQVTFTWLDAVCIFLCVLAVIMRIIRVMHFVVILSVEFAMLIAALWKEPWCKYYNDRQLLQEKKTLKVIIW